MLSLQNVILLISSSRWLHRNCKNIKKHSFSEVFFFFFFNLKHKWRQFEQVNPALKVEINKPPQVDVNV